MFDCMTTIGEIADIFDGPHATPKKIKKGAYFLSISSLDRGRLDLSKSAFVSENDFRKWTKRVTPKKGDLLFSYETRLGEAALMPDGIRACLGRRMGLLRPKINKVIPEYLLYAYLSPYFQQVIASNTITGATVDRIALNEMASFEIRIPSLKEQKKVAGLLQAIDAKIELNNRINAELEAMAKTLYDYWFVQFDFPDENGKPYKSSGGKMVYNETLKREIPEGWTVNHLFDAVDVQYGFPFSTKQFTDEVTDIPVVRIRDILDNTISLYSSEITDDKYRLQPNDLLIGMDGNFHMNFWDKDGAYLNQRCVRLRAPKSSRISNFQIYFELMPFIKLRERVVSRTTVGHLSDKDFKSLYLLSPSENSSFNSKGLFDKTLDKIITNRLEIQQLTQLRDWLLPMLMNGQVTVK